MEEQFGQGVDLTRRELEILHWLAQGLTNKGIARTIPLAEKTVETTLTVIYEKLEVTSRTQAVIRFNEIKLKYNLLQKAGNDFLEILQAVRVKGQPGEAIKWAPHVAGWIQTEMESSQFRGHAKLLLKIQARLLFEFVIAHCETFPSDKIQEDIWSAIRKIRRIAKLCEDQELVGLADYLTGVVYYILNEYHKSVGTLKKALPALEKVDNQVMSWRTLILDWAYLDDRDNFRVAEGELRRLIDQGNFSDSRFACMALEGLGRGQGLLGLPSAFDTLEEGWHLYAKMEAEGKKQPLLQVQLGRSGLEIICCLEPGDKRFLEAQVNKALSLAREYDYTRYIRQIERLTEKYLP